MFVVDDKEVESKSDLLEDCFQFTSKTKRSTLCLSLQQTQCSAEQDNAWKGSEILEREVSRIFEQANKRIYG